MLLRQQEIKNLINGVDTPKFSKYNFMPNIQSKNSQRSTRSDRNIIKLGNQIFHKIEIETRQENDIDRNPKKEFKIPQIQLHKNIFIEDKNSMIVKISENVLSSRKPEQTFTLLFYEDIEKEISDRHKQCMTESKLKRNNSGVAESLKSIKSYITLKNGIKTSSSYFNTDLPQNTPRKPFEFPTHQRDKFLSPARRLYSVQKQKRY